MHVDARRKRIFLLPQTFQPCSEGHHGRDVRPMARGLGHSSSKCCQHAKVLLEKLGKGTAAMTGRSSSEHRSPTRSTAVSIEGSWQRLWSALRANARKRLRKPGATAFQKQVGKSTRLSEVCFITSIEHQHEEHNNASPMLHRVAASPAPQNPVVVRALADVGQEGDKPHVLRKLAGIARKMDNPQPRLPRPYKVWTGAKGYNLLQPFSDFEIMRNLTKDGNQQPLLFPVT